MTNSDAQPGSDPTLDGICSEEQRLRDELAARAAAEAAIRQSEESLRRVREDLERRVAQRTAELAASKTALEQEVEERQQLEEELRTANEELERRVHERTEELVAERQRLYSALETLPVYVILLSADYHVPFANKFFRDRFGDSNGKRCHEYLFGRAEPCDNCETYRALKTGLPHHWEWVGPDGRNYDIYDYPFHDVDGAMMVLEVGIDITEQKRAQASLRAASQYTRSLIEASPDPLVTIAADGRITDVNEATIRATGLPRQELIGTDFSTYFTEPERARAGYQRVFAEGSVTDYPLTIRHKDGRLMDVLYNATVYRDASGDVQGVFAAARDVTKRKQAEAAAQAERKRFFDVLETLPPMICLLTPDRHVAFANRAFRDRFGESGGRHCYEYCFGETAPCEFCESFQVLETGQPHHWEVHTREGATIEVHDFPFTDVDGSPMVLEMDLDVTDRKRAEAELTRHREQLEELVRQRTARLAASTAELSNEVAERRRVERVLRDVNETLEQKIAERTAVAERRAADLRRLAAELSEAEHRERTRLAGLLHDDLQQLLLAIKLRLPALAESDPRELGPQIERLDELVGECLRTSRSLTQELSPPIIQCGTLVELFEWLAHRFSEKHGLTVAVHSSGDVPSAPEYIRVFLFQAARELLLNATKHSGSMAAEISLSHQDTTLRVEVADGGTQFDPQAVETRLQRPEGFGLFNIRERLEALGGRMEMEATRQGGGCFRLIIPITDDGEAPRENTMIRQAKTPRKHARKPRAKGSAIRLLVVDDHAVVRQGFIGLLNLQPDFDVIGEARDGQEAIERAETLRPDAIVMDVDMPNVDGVEATRKIKERQPEIVIIGLSLHEETGVMRAMTQAGADAYVSKHAPAKDLVKTIRRVCIAEPTTT